MASSSHGPAEGGIFRAAPCANKTLAALFAEILDQSETGSQPIQVLGRIAVAVRRRNPGEVQQVGGSQRRDQASRGYAT